MIDLKDAIRELNTKIDFSGAEMLTEGECVIFLRELECLRQFTDGIPLDRLKEICNAERDGRCVVLPSIPYNKTLYWIWGDEIMPVHYRGIHGGCVTKDGVYHVSCDMVTKKPRSFPYIYRGKAGINTYPAGNERMFYADDIGKTVFLTLPEAEAALNKSEASK